MLTLLPLALLAATRAEPTLSEQPHLGPYTPALAAAPPVPELPPLLVDPELLSFVDAPYPPAALADGLEGVVLLLIGRAHPPGQRPVRAAADHRGAPGATRAGQSGQAKLAGRAGRP